MDLGALSCPGRVPEQRLSVPRISPSVAAALQRFSWISSRLCSVFQSEASYRHRNQGQWGSRGPTPSPGTSRACPCLGGLATLWPPSGFASWFRVAPGKIITLAFVPSNSENIDFLPFWNQKHKKTGNWHYGNLLIG